MLNPTASTTVTSTVTSAATVMEIDHDGMSTVLSILSNMYSDGSLAVVREYSCNALDSHVEAGNPDPILVTAPSAFDPRLIVQDFGVGLSRDEVLNVYAKYGASTKRESNEQIGAFGIGAKSAFTVSTQFVVTAVKDGERTVVLFALDESGAPTVNIVDHGQTAEPNGVRVEIGVSDVRGVQSAIERLFSTWQPGTVLVDGVEPATIWANTDKMTDGIHLGSRDRYSDETAFVVVMGGVNYKLTSAAIEALDNRQRTVVHNVEQTSVQVILNVPIGSVDITPSREELRVTPKTTATLNAKVNEFYGALPSWVTKQISESKSMVAALIMRNKLRNNIGSFAREVLDAATWNGQPLRTTKISTSIEYMALRQGRNWNTKLVRREQSLELHPNGALDRVLFVLNTPKRRVRSVQLAAKPYLTDQEQSEDKGQSIVTIAVLEGDSFKDDWFDVSDPAVAKVDFDTFIAQWKPVPVTGNKTPGAPIMYDTEGGDPLTAAELAELDDVLYLRPTDPTSAMSDHMQTIAQTHTVVKLSKRQQEEVFLRRVPNAKLAVDKLRAMAQAELDTMTQNDKDIFAAVAFTQNMDSTVLSFLAKHRNEITNPVVLSVIAQNDSAAALHTDVATRRINRLRKLAIYLGATLDTGASTISSTDYDNMVEALPLLPLTTNNYRFRNHERGIDDRSVKHLIEYINHTAI